MMYRYMIAVLFAGILFGVLIGCNGSSAPINPSVTFTQPANSTLPTIPANGIMNIQGTVTLPSTSGSGGSTSVTDSVISTEWTQDASVPGVFSTPDSVNTTWLAPAWTGPGDLPVTLFLTVKTLLGGKTVQRINLLVIPG